MSDREYYEELLDGLIANFDAETNALSSPIAFLTRLADALDSEAAFIAMPRGPVGFDIPYIYTEDNRMKKIKAIADVGVFSRIVNQNEAITVNEENYIDGELRKLGITSMLAVPFPLPHKTCVLTVCNRKSPRRFGVKYISYDVKICSTIAYLLSRGLQMFEAPFALIARRLENLQSDTDELRDAIQELTEAVRDLARPGSAGLVMSDFAREIYAYLHMEKELLEKYPKQFVGIYEGELIAVNPDKMELIAEIQRKRGKIRAFIHKVTEEQTFTKLPTSRQVMR